MIALTITGLYATLLALLMIVLGIRVSSLRMKHRVGLLDGGNPELTRAMRIHGNIMEWIPMALILFACAESQRLGFLWLHILGIILLLSRILHMQGLIRSSGRSFGRMVGMLGTWSVMLILGIYNLYALLSGLLKS